MKTDEAQCEAEQIFIKSHINNHILLFPDSSIGGSMFNIWVSYVFVKMRLLKTSIN